MGKGLLIKLFTGAAILSLSLWGCGGSSGDEPSVESDLVSAAAAPTDRGRGSNTTQQILDPATIPQFTSQLVIPPAMPYEDKGSYDYYEIAVRQFKQQILPSGYPPTTVWSYGFAGDEIPEVAPDLDSTFNYPAFTIEATHNRPVVVKWINDLVDKSGNFLPHLLPVDQSLHWANPPQQCFDGTTRTDCRGFIPGEYRGPVPIITHVHGAHTYEQYDGYPEAWYLPDARNIPGNYARFGTIYEEFKQEADEDGLEWGPGFATFKYPNDQRDATLWYHDHTLGMTRLNVYAGPAGFYLLRGHDADQSVSENLPGPAPGVGASPFDTFYEIPIVIQDRTFSTDGSLFYPNSRNFFDDYHGPPIPGSDVSRIWNPEFFGNTIVANGNTWPYLEVEPKRYRLRFLNGGQSRFFILKAVKGEFGSGYSDPVATSAALNFHQIGSDGGFLPNVEEQSELLLGPAERADVIVDFSIFSEGDVVTLVNIAPDEPFGGGRACEQNEDPETDNCFPPADLATTGQVMQFRIAEQADDDYSAAPSQLDLPDPEDLGAATGDPIKVSLNEEESEGLCVVTRGKGSGAVEKVVPCSSVPEDERTHFAPVAALLGTVNPDGSGKPLLWMDPTTENPVRGSTKTWEIYNFTEDAHPIHIHLVQFEVVDREEINEDGTLAGAPRPPESWESGRKDTVIAYPGEVTRLKAHFDIAGLFVWHCHILEHEDNEMMRPYRVVDADE